jgi:hypothetical protein
MAAALYLVNKSGSGAPSERLVNGIHAMIINADDGGSAADTIADAVAKAVAAGHPLRTGYFDTVTKIGVPTGGDMTTDTDARIVLARDIVDLTA